MKWPYLTLNPCRMPLLCAFSRAMVAAAALISQPRRMWDLGIIIPTFKCLFSLLTNAHENNHKHSWHVLIHHWLALIVFIMDYFHRRVDFLENKLFYYILRMDHYLLGMGLLFHLSFKFCHWLEITIHVHSYFKDISKCL